MGFYILWTGPGFLDSLDDKVRWLQEQVFAPITRLTYASQRKLYQHFCVFGDINPVPLPQENACRYIAFLSKNWLNYTSIKQYINVVRIMHLEAGHTNPFQGSWYIDILLKGTKRVLGVSHKQKLPITPAILRQLFKLIDFTLTLEVTFWAACLVAFFSFFRKPNLLVRSITSFDSNLH